jgi:hypothetical protein
MGKVSRINTVAPLSLTAPKAPAAFPCRWVMRLCAWSIAWAKGWRFNGSCSPSPADRRKPLPPERSVVLERDDEVVVAGPSSAIITAGTHIGPKIDGREMLHDVTGEVLDVMVCT